MTDYISASERVPPRRNKVLEYFAEIWFRFHLKHARMELEKAKVDVAALWRAHKVKLEDKLRELGIDPNQEPEPLDKILEVWLVGLMVVASIAVVLLYMGVRADLIEIVSRRL